MMGGEGGGGEGLVLGDELGALCLGWDGMG